MASVLITTDYLAPGDDVYSRLTAAGHSVAFAPHSGPRGRAGELALFDGFDAAIVANEPVTAAMLDAAPGLRIIARSGVGYDAIDTGAAAERGIWVCNAPGVNHHAVAEMTIALMLAIARRLPDVIFGVREGKWPRQGGTELCGHTLGVIGFGPSGRAVADLGRAFGMRVLVTTSHPHSDGDGVEFVDLDHLCRQSDYVSLHCKADATNTRLINQDRLSTMKPTAVLINTARGSLVDEAALCDALGSGRLAGAALDVLENEPLPPDARLRRRSDVIVTSHLAGQTAEARKRAGISAAENVLAVLDGRPPRSPVNAPLLDSRS